MRTYPLSLVWFIAWATSVGAADRTPAASRPTADYVPDVAALATPHDSELRELVERFVDDRKEIDRFYDVPGSALRQKRLQEFLQTWQAKLAAVDFDRLGVEGRIDATLLRTHLAHELHLLDRDAQRTAEMAPLLPFAADVAQLQESRRFLERADPQRAAETLDRMRKAVEKTKGALEAGLAKGKPDPSKPASTAADTGGAKEHVTPLTTTKVIAYRAVNRLDALKKSLEEWFKTYDGYDPAFGWWAREPYGQLTEALDDYRKFLREKILGVDRKSKDDPIVGDPVGRDGLTEELENEMIPYTPEELIAIAEREFTWVDNELKRAAREMGFGDDWKAALNKVKEDHVAPGGQPTLIRDSAWEAIRFIESHDLVTVPPLSADVWLVKMMPPAQQKVAPFFLGGSDILVAFPTDTMTEDEKEQSLRSNNRHFARATVFHELVPGHHLQFWARERYNPHRQLFATPFWMEGWAVWWEFHLWDLRYLSTPEDRIGALFWRAHRCARIIFSLKFHLGEWTPQQCIEFLIDRVGHERASATGEVRRSFNGDWSPLYQAGYMLGAMQLRSLYRQLVPTGKMTERQFHDAILAGGEMPIEMVRAHVLQEKLPRDFKPSWRFAD